MNDELNAISREFFTGSHRQGMTLVEAALRFREERIAELERAVEEGIRELELLDAKLERLQQGLVSTGGVSWPD